MNAPILSTQVAAEAASPTAAKTPVDTATAAGAGVENGPPTAAQLFALLFGGQLKAAAVGNPGAAVPKAAGAKLKAQATGAKLKAQATGAELKAQATGAELKAQAAGAKLKAQAAGAKLKAQTAGAELKAQAAGAELKAQAAGAELKAQAAGAELKAQAVGAKLKARAAAKTGGKLAADGNAAGKAAAQQLPQDGNSLPLMQLLEAILAGGTTQHVQLNATQLADSAASMASHSGKSDQSGEGTTLSGDPLLALVLSANASLPAMATTAATAADDPSGADALVSTTLARTQHVLQVALAQAASSQAPDGTHHDASGPVSAKDAGSPAVAAVHTIAPKATVDAPARSVPSVPVQQSMHKPGWGQELGSRIVWMARQNIQAARLQVNPPHLGPVEVKVSIHNDSASVSFIAHHVQAREAIEAAVPRLREMMGQQGFMQTSVDVSGQEQQQQQQQNPAAQAGFDIQALDESTGEGGGSLLSGLLGSRIGLGAVDYFA